MSAWTAAWIGLGSNLGEPVEQLRGALAALARLPGTRVHRVSGFYRNPPMGPLDQPDYVNAVAGLLTELPVRSLLEGLQAIEHAAGRRRGAGPRWGPRLLDLDLLTFGFRRLREPGLSVPHPGIAERNFVLLPLLEVAPDLTIPGLGAVHRLARAADDRHLTRLAVDVDPDPSTSG